MSISTARSAINISRRYGCQVRGTSLPLPCMHHAEERVRLDSCSGWQRSKMTADFGMPSAPVTEPSLVSPNDVHRVDLAGVPPVVFDRATIAERACHGHVREAHGMQKVTVTPVSHHCRRALSGKVYHPNHPRRSFMAGLVAHGVSTSCTPSALTAAMPCCSADRRTI